jgi:hypothetical protein
MKKMKKIFVTILIFSSYISVAQQSINNLPIDKIPQIVQNVLNEYISILNSENLDICAEKFAKIAGGSLLNADGLSLRNNVKPYALKSDFENIKNYKQPIEIKEINASKSSSQGFGKTAISGELFKIWIFPISDSLSLKASISIILPDEFSNVKEAKVVNIGTL